MGNGPGQLDGMSFRTIREGEEQKLLHLLKEAHGIFHDTPGTRLVLSSRRFVPDGCFVFEEADLLAGSVAVTKLPHERWFVIRYLAAKNAESRAEVLQKLLERAVQYTRTESAEFVKAATPALEPYVTVYKKTGFRPLRKDFRIAWDLNAQDYRRSDLQITELRHDAVNQAAEAYVESLRPFWDWRTEEYGGTEAMANSFKESVRLGVRWLLCHSEGRIVGLAGVQPDVYGSGQARFRGVSVIPEYRERGLGLALMHEIMDYAKRLGQVRMTVYTFSHLDHLAPGAALYLRTRGRIEAEYLQLQL